jgi:D-arabinose 1-dehydrogenase-like Zn-dependent alcohol dehydrogenase
LGATNYVVSSDKAAMKAARSSLDFILCTAAFDTDWNALVDLLDDKGVLCCVGIPGDFDDIYNHLCQHN